MRSDVTNIELPEAGQLVAGEWSAPTERLDLVLEDPYRGTSLGAAAATSDTDVERALTTAQAAYDDGGWLTLDVERRAEILDAVGTALEAELPRIAGLEAFATGVPVRQTSIVGVIVPGAFHLAAGMLRAGVLRDDQTSDAGNAVEVHRLPLGPAVCLVPWNAPAPMAAHKVASALAAGAPTILKPSEYAPYGTSELGRVVGRVLAEAGVHPGMFQLVQGGPHVGGLLVRDRRVRAVSFTGGALGGRAVAAACAEDFTALQLELGGNNPLVVMPDADPAAAAQAATDLLTTLNGQWCRALGRLILPAAIADEVLALALDRLGKLTVGDPLDPETDLGPIVHSAHAARLRDEIATREAAGGTAHASTTVPDGDGSFLAPTLLTGVPGEAATEEMFGPVATVHTYETEAEAVALANGTPFGLEGYVVGTDTDRAMAVARQVRAGEVKVNGSTIMSLHLMTPRPAWGLSGLGEEGTVETIRTFTGARVVGVEGMTALHGR
ncbi:MULTISPECIES: aldehyde dehydrogenase family protein [Nocardioides]|uniref:aldehyde dehydrogenase family protein n=1 Tax=Nocardioides TaxID=1839 RepID=UPI0018E029B3|nr:aldehyde dehydrogenase [Nocardioides sp. CGMCC 1.13656]